jgi:hypothetical protein
MDVSARSEASLALLMLSMSVALASPSAPISGFDFCSAPHPPACADKDEVYGDKLQTKACQDAITHFIDEVFAYRACLQREIKRAVLETNTALDRFKCGLEAKRRCSKEELLYKANNK